MISLPNRSALLLIVFCLLFSIHQPAVSVNDQTLSTGDSLYQPDVGQSGKDVIWVPTNDDLVKMMLNIANVKPTDVVYDLGAGDGKIAIAAARDYGARAVGIEYNPDMAALAQRNAERSGVADKVKIINGDIFVEDFSEATVVTLYLLPNLNLQLRPTLLDMKPGTRVVSNSFTMGDWEPDHRIGSNYTIGYFWVVPAKVGGTWQLRGQDLRDAELVLDQKFQNIGGTLIINGQSQPVLSPKLSGDNLSFRFLNEVGKHRLVETKVAGDRMVGQVSETDPIGQVVGQRIKPAAQK
uniref:methyltransferase domain-containing protein n=1 Tax=Orrella sp. TaxID=1921583 RepID=UPI00404866CC